MEREENQENQIRLEDLAPSDDPDAVLAEVKHIFGLMFDTGGFGVVEEVWADVRRLFDGRYPGYQACNVKFHDFGHTADCLLATARLVHGGFLEGVDFSERETALVLISALMHDTGFIQEEGDTAGTGAKYTVWHVQRSIRFLEAYFADRDFSTEDFELCRRCLKCTGFDVHVGDVYFPTRRHELLGKILGTADLLGQLAEPGYMGKLGFLYGEFMEAGVTGYESEMDLLRKTETFHLKTRKRFTGQLGGVYQFARSHFRERWGLDRDLYQEAIERNMENIGRIVRQGSNDIRPVPAGRETVLSDGKEE